MLGGCFFPVVLGEVGDVFRVVEVFFTGIYSRTMCEHNIQSDLGETVLSS